MDKRRISKRACFERTCSAEACCRLCVCVWVGGRQTVVAYSVVVGLEGCEREGVVEVVDHRTPFLEDCGEECAAWTEDRCAFVSVLGLYEGLIYIFEVGGT
jgi:hypothetical protein